MEEGEEGAEIQDQGLAQATAASESRDATEKDGAGNQDSEEENHEEEEDQTGNSWGHAKLPGDVYGSSPFLKSGRNKQHVVWDDVKFMKKHTAKVLQSTRSIHMSVWLASRPRKQARRERMRMVRETGDGIVTSS
jgi:hypothetical protein